MMHPSTQIRVVDPRIGYGVVATELIPAGTITWVRDELDQSFTPERAASFGPPYDEILEKYAYLDGYGDILLCWDHGRLVNHSCEATCLPAGWPDFEIAIRDIHPGEEVTDDYGTLNVEGGFDCLCGSPRCRKRILGDDLLRLAPAWDAIVGPPMRKVKSVRQPLWDLVRSKADVERAIRGEIPIPSIQANHRTR